MSDPERRTARQRVLTLAVVVMVALAFAGIGYAIASALRSTTLTQTVNLYATSFNNSGISSFPNFPTIYQPEAPTPPAIDGSASSAASESGPSSLAVTLTTSLPGDLLVLLLATDKQHSVTAATSVSDTFGLAWALQITVLEYVSSGTFSPAWLCIFYAEAGTHVGSDTITVSFGSDTVNAATEIAFGVSGASPTPWDGSPVTTQGTGTSATAQVTTSNADDLVFSFLGVLNTPTITTTSSFVRIAAVVPTPSDFTSYAEYARTTSPGTYTSSPQWSTSQTYGMIIAAVSAPNPYQPAGARANQPCTGTLYLPGGSGAQTPYPAFVNATGSGTTCFRGTQSFMYLGWQLTANQTTRSIPPKTYYLNFSSAWIPWGGGTVHTFAASLPVRVNATQTNGPTLVIYLMFGPLPSGAPLGTKQPVILEVAATLAP